MNYLSLESGKTIIHGFDKLVGGVARINVAEYPVISFEKASPDTKDLTCCIRFDEKTLNKRVVSQFLTHHNLYLSYFAESGDGAYTRMIFAV